MQTKYVSVHTYNMFPT